MFIRKILSILAAVACTSLAQAAPPTTYTITSTMNAPSSGTMTVYRSGSMALIEYNRPTGRSRTLYDLAAMTTTSWDPSSATPSCGTGTFSGDWGDPFALTAQVSDGITKGDLKPAGTETLNGIATKVYAGTTNGSNVKVWFDEADALAIRATVSMGGTSMTLADIQKVSLTAPPASLFTLPAGCAGAKPALTPAQAIAAKTGDSGDNFVEAIYGPGSKNSCSIMIRVVAAKTMAPVTRRWQAAIDTTYNVDSPPKYTFGVGNDGTSTFSGGGLHEITSQIRNDMLQIDNPPAYFELSLNVVQPGHGAGDALIYRQCFAPVTMLYYVLTDPNDPGKGGDFLYAKAGKYAVVPAR